MSLSSPLKAQIEALIFASPLPLSVGDIHSYLGDEAHAEDIKTCLAQLKQDYPKGHMSQDSSQEGTWFQGRGFYLDDTPGMGWQFKTHEALYPVLETMFASKARPLSRAAQETMAIVAYRQPVTRADIEFIRGVDAGSILKNLIERNLVRCVGRKEDSGRPMLFGTTEEFLKVYGLLSLKDLPPLDAFQPSLETLNKSLQNLGIQTEVDFQHILPRTSPQDMG